MPVTATNVCSFALQSFDATIELSERVDDDGNPLDTQFKKDHFVVSRYRRMEGITAYTSDAGTYTSGVNVSWETSGNVISANPAHQYLCTSDSLQVDVQSLQTQEQSWEYLTNIQLLNTANLSAGDITDTGSITAECIGDWTLDSYQSAIELQEVYSADNEDTVATKRRQHNIINRTREIVAISQFTPAAGDIFEGTSVDWLNGNDILLAGLAGQYYICTGDSIQMQGDTELGLHAQQWESFGSWIILSNP